MFAELPTPVDRAIVPGVHIDDLDHGLIERTIQSGRSLGRFKETIDSDAYLLRYGGAVYDGTTLCPTVAGVLSFTQHPERWLTASGIDIALYRTEQTLPTRARVEQVRGPIFQVIDEAVTILQNECTVGRLDGARLVTELDTPLIVLRELTTNAVVHRDLSLFGSVVRVQAFLSHLEWASPGGLPRGITVENILTAQFARNPSLAQFLFHAGYIEKFGMGLDAVIDAMHNARLGAPDFHDDSHSFRVRVRRRTDITATVDLTTREGRAAAIINLFRIKSAWRQHDMLEQLGVPRSTLQRDLEQLVREGQVLVRGATKNRVYSLADSEQQ